MALYMKVTDDEYELPVAIADSAGELATMLGKSKYTVRSAFQRVKKGIVEHSTYVIVDDKEN